MILFGAAVVVAAFRIASEPTTPAERLVAAGQAVERLMSAGETHVYRISCHRGDYVRATVEQQGVDVVVTVLAPNGSEVLEIDGPTGRSGREIVLFVAEEAGDYRIRIGALDGDRQATYLLRLEEQRLAVPTDRARFDVWRSWQEANRLRALGSGPALRQSLDAYEQAANAFERLGDLEPAAIAMTQVGQVAVSLGESRRAVDAYERVLALTSAEHPTALRGSAYMGLGMGQRERAIEHFERALAIFQQLEDHFRQTLALSSLALVRAEQLGESSEAIRLLEQALAISRAHGLARLERQLLHNIGTLYGRRDEKQKALACLEEALRLEREADDRAQLALTLDEIGSLHAQSGDYARAVDFHEEALLEARRRGNRVREATILANRGRAQLAQGQLDKAVESLARSVELSHQAEEKDVEAAARASLGGVYARRGDLQLARDHLEQALAIFRGSLVKYWSLLALVPLGNVYLSQGDDARAEKAWQEAVEIARVSGSQGFEAASLHGLARLALRRGDPRIALENAEKAVATVESERASLARADLRTTYFASVHSYYQTHIQALMELHAREPDAGYAARALQVSERARARRMLEASAESAVDIQGGADPPLLARERALRQDLRALATQSEDLLGKGAAPARREAIEKRLREVSADHQDALARLRESSPRNALARPAVLEAGQIQRELLEPGTTLLEYALGDDHSYLWVVTSDVLAARELPPRTTIERLAGQLYDATTDRARRIRAGASPASDTASNDGKAEALARELARMILPDDLDDLHTKRLVIVADGALQKAPFGALPWPFTGRAGRGARVEPLATRFELTHAPSASWVASLRRTRRDLPAATRTLAVLADPVYEHDDVRLGGSVRASPSQSASLRQALEDVELRGAKAELPRLFFSRREATSAASLTRDALVLLDFEASRERAMQPDLARYRIVHFATHSLVDDEHPDLSGIVLSMLDARGRPQDGFLRLQDIYNLKLPAEVVVLSACQTALGKPVAGEGLLGLARGFMYAGARRVVASLWPVDDAATSALMRSFYRGVLRDGLTPAAALGRAQRDLASTTQWHAPYYWAGFVVQGDWP